MRDKPFEVSEGGRRARIFLLIACYFFVETVFFREGLADKLAYLIFGLAVLAFGMAEFVPRDRTGLAGALKICGVGLMVAILAVRAVQLIVYPG